MLKKWIERLNIPFNNLDKKLWIIGILLFLVIRFTNLTIIPIFTDEAIYIRWSEIAWKPNLERLGEARTSIFIPLSDGKQPLYMWLAGIPMQFTTDHLWAGRLPAIFAGLFAMIGLWLVTYELFKRKKIAYIASAVYMVLPFTLLYDRMMLADSMLAMWGIWSLYLSIILVKTRSLKVGIALGVVYGLGLLTKSPALFYILLTPLTLVFFNNITRDGQLQTQNMQFWKWKKTEWSQLLRLTYLWGIAIVIGQMFQGILRISNMYHMIGRKNLEFVLTTQEFLEKPFSLFYGNLIGTSNWFYQYLGTALILCIAVALVIALIKRDIRIALLTLLVIIPWFGSISMAKVLYPRYLLFFTPPLLIIIAYGIHAITDLLNINTVRYLKNYKHRLLLQAIVILAIFSTSLVTSYYILFNPPAAKLALQDREQYIVGWPSGYGVDQITEFLMKEYKEKGKLAVGTEGTFGLMPFALQIKFYDEIYNQPGSNEKLFIDGYWPFDRVPQKIVELAAGRPTYFVVYQTEKDPPPEFPLELVMKIEKPGGQASMRLYKVTPVWRYTPEGVIKN
jgi:hypothetical protein